MSLAARYERLLALEIDRILGDLTARRGLLLEVWGRHRDRGPFLDTVATRWGTLGFPELAVLEEPVLLLVEAFYRELEDFRLYVSFTEDMPTTLAERYDAAVAHLRSYGEPALEGLGGAPALPKPRPILPLGLGPPRPVPAVLPPPAAPIELDPSAQTEAGVEGVLYQELLPGESVPFGPSPAQLLESEESRAERERWRKHGKSFA